MALYDSMFTADIKKEDRDSMFTPINVYLVALMNDLSKVPFMFVLIYVSS